MTGKPEELATKIDRLDSMEQIRQLAFQYALAVDMRDIDAIVSLHVDEIKVKGIGQGRAALKQHFDRVLRGFTEAKHLVGNHIIEFEDADHAIGMVYCRCEHEIETKWVIMPMLYLDTYERRGGVWYFARQRYLGRWYANEWNEPPIGNLKVRWPGRKWADGNFQERFPAYQAFWAKDSVADEAIAPVERDKFLRFMLRNQPIPER